MTYYCSHCDATFATKEECIAHGEQHEMDYYDTIQPKSSHTKIIEDDIKLVRKRGHQKVGTMNTMT